ncbi:MAG: hypothetical protein AABM41_06875 [Chloroflexota bacterium]
MRAPESLLALRVVASPPALDGLAWPDAVTALRLAPDDLLVIGKAMVALGDEPAIIESDVGYAGWWLTPGEFAHTVLPHVDWPLPAARPALAQGLVAGVPAKIWLTDDQALLLCAAAYAHELAERLA